VVAEYELPDHNQREQIFQTTKSTAHPKL